MKFKDSRRIILDMVKKELDRAHQDRIRATIENEGRKARIAAYDEEYKNDIGPAFGRPSIEETENRLEEKVELLKVWEKTYEYAINTFLEKSPINDEK